MTLNTIYNESCMETMKKMKEHSVDIVLTSPFYNTNKRAGSKGTLLNTKVKKRIMNTSDMMFMLII